MKIAQLQDGEALEGGRQIGEGEAVFAEDDPIGIAPPSGIEPGRFQRCAYQGGGGIPILEMEELSARGRRPSPRTRARCPGAGGHAGGRGAVPASSGYPRPRRSPDGQACRHMVAVVGGWKGEDWNATTPRLAQRPLGLADPGHASAWGALRVHDLGRRPARYDGIRRGLPGGRSLCPDSPGGPPSRQCAEGVGGRAFRSGQAPLLLCQRRLGRRARPAGGHRRRFAGRGQARHHRRPGSLSGLSRDRHRDGGLCHAGGGWRSAAAQLRSQPKALPRSPTASPRRSAAAR